mgnify:CR=1 FL=1
MQSLWMVAAGLAFAGMGIFVKMAAAEFSVAEIVLYRSVIQMVIAWVALARTGSTVRTDRFGMHVHRGVAGFVSLFCFFYSLVELPVATAVTLNYTSPIFLAMLLAALARERPSPRLVGTILFGFAGIVLLLRPVLHQDQLWPGFVGLMSGVISSVAYWNVRRLVQSGEPEARVVFYFALFAALGALVWMAPQPWHAVRMDNGWQLAAVGVLGSAGQMFMTRAYGQGSTLITAALSYSGIVFSSVLGILAFGDVLPVIAWVGMAMIVAAGIIAVQLRPGAERGPAPPSSSD